MPVVVVVAVVVAIFTVVVATAAHPVIGVLFELIEVEVDAEDVLGLLEGGVGVLNLVFLLGGDRLTFFVYDEIVGVRLVLRVSPVFGVSAERTGGGSGDTGEGGQCGGGGDRVVIRGKWKRGSRDGEGS